MGDVREKIVEIFQGLRPSFVSRHPHFNFITVHYFWIIGMSILASILVYASAGGQLAYIDALFLASGANTQAGLNTIDINLLNTFQQAVLYIFSMISSPITIHSSVVFLRLYWFEKRFQHVVKEARSRRGTLSKSRSKARPTAADVETGVNGRSIRVMHDTAIATGVNNEGSIALNDYMTGAAIPKDSSASGSSSAEHENMEREDSNRHQEPHPTSPTTIKFADKVKRSDRSSFDNADEYGDMSIPARHSNAEHIAVLERQRKLDSSVLRIPGPRDVERGVKPEELTRDDDGRPNHLARQRTRDTLEHNSDQPRMLSSHGDRQQTITIAEPVRPSRHEQKVEDIAEDAEAAAHVFSPLKYIRSRGRGPEALHPVTSRGTSSSATRNPLHRIRTALTFSKDEEPMPYLSWQPTIGRNSAFVGLSEEQREELGGIEYRSLKTLAILLLVYFWGFTLFSIITMVPWILNDNERWGPVVDAAGQSRTWWGFFTAGSALMDLGFTLTPDSMISFNTATFPLLIMSFLIIAGNTGFPILLRFMIWLTSLFVPRGTGLWEELKFLLDHPRRCFTMLFPANATWWLFFILVVLNGLDLILFIILDLNAEAVESLPLSIRFLDGWFQATSTRTAGFAVINLATLHPAVQTSYLIMMYISVLPIAISIRRTNVYEEKSLGVYQAAEEVDDSNNNSFSYVGAHLRRQLSFDLWYIFIGYFILTISEGGRLATNDISMFGVLFEVVSAYGTVGLSLGYTGINASLCSQFSVVGKLVIIAMQIRGRHRGLPYGLDRAVLLPSEHLDRKEQEDAEFRLHRRNSAMSTATGRPTSLARGRSRSVDKRRVFQNLLHPGPAYQATATGASVEQQQQAFGFGKGEQLRRYTSAPVDDEVSPGPPINRDRRAKTSPDFDG
ncbi:cation transport protein-domain-containing protein [Microdochium bolleyi]|uniref:Potassium transport protein n=1 Tax=Microdochium bolleyi TaxID=196109 RepID=A0A136JBA3_9PEZI|nr:cation transport protein-domain-containing protein [Microdochium bolleyi]